MRTSILALLSALLLGIFAGALGYAQRAPDKSESEATAPAGPLPSSLSAEQIKALIGQVAERDLENDKKLRDYTYVEREERHTLDGKGRVKSVKSDTHEIMMLYGEQVERLLAKDDKALPASDAAKEERRIQKIIDKRKNESEEQRQKRREKEKKDRQEAREFVREVADAYNFRFVGIEDVDGRPTYVIDAEPRPGFQPHRKEARILTKIRFRIWIDQAESEWVKLNAECIDTVSFGLFLVRLHKGTTVHIEQTRVNNEVWLPKHVWLNVDARLALLKNFDMEDDFTYRDYRKFRSDIKILPAEQTAQ